MHPKNTHVALICQQCGAAYEVKPSRAAKSKYCSGACQRAVLAQRTLAKRPVKQCAHCGKTFTRIPNQLKKAKYCSTQCQCAARTGRKIVAPLSRHCVICGEIFEVQKNRPNHRFCSLKCYGESLKGTSPLTDRPAQYTDRRRGYVYIKVPEHPNATKAGYVAEHRLVAEKKIGRYLRPDEIVHHINGDGSDNSPDNLEVMTQAEHARIHRVDGRFR